MISESKAKSIAAFCAGFSSLIIQTILLRRMVILFDGSELVLAVCLACWLLGLATGARAGSIVVGKKIPAINDLAALVLGGGAIYGVIAFKLADSGRWLLRLDPGEPAGMTALMAAGILVLCIGGAFFGSLFPLLAAGEQRCAARIYVDEAIGGFTGGIVYTFLMAGQVDDLFNIALCGPLLAVAAMMLVLAASKRPKPVIVLMAIYLCSLPLRFAADPSLISEGDKNRFSSLAPGLELIGKMQTPYAEYLVGQGDGEKTLFISGRATATFPAQFEVTTETALLGSAPAKIDRVLMVGGVARGQLAELLKFPVHSIEYLEHDSYLPGFLSRFLTERDARALRDPKVKLIQGDARSFIADPENGDWDLVVLNVPEPSGLGVNRFYTEQFYRLLAERENAPVVVTCLAAAPNYLGGEAGQVSAAIYKAMRASFNEVEAIPGTKTTFFAGPNKDAFTLNAETLANRYMARGRPLDDFDERAFGVLADGTRIAETRATFAAADVLPNDDYRPTAAYRTLLILMRSTGGIDPDTLGGNRKGIGLLTWLASVPGWIYLTFPVLVIAIRLRRNVLSRRLIEKSLIFNAGISGFYGFVWQFVMIYCYQIKYGSLYGRLGFLIALYFAGLAVGAGLARTIDRAACRTTVLRWQPVITALAAGPLILMLLPLSQAGEIAFYLATVIGAAIVGFDFTLLLEAELFEKGSGRAGGIYAADNAGGMVGSLAVGMFLLPLTGIYYTLGLIAAIKISAVVYLKK